MDLLALEEQRRAERQAAHNAVLAAALAWWERKRPLSRDLRSHLDNPTVNTATNTESALAKAVATAVEVGAL